MYETRFKGESGCLRKEVEGRWDKYEMRLLGDRKKWDAEIYNINGGEK